MITFQVRDGECVARQIREESDDGTWRRRYAPADYHCSLRGDPNAYNLISFDRDRIVIDVREWRDGIWLTRESNKEPAEPPLAGGP